MFAHCFNGRQVTNSIETTIRYVKEKRFPLVGPQKEVHCASVVHTLRKSLKRSTTICENQKSYEKPVKNWLKHHA